MRLRCYGTVIMRVILQCGNSVLCATGTSNGESTATPLQSVTNTAISRNLATASQNVGSHYLRYGHGSLNSQYVHNLLVT